MKYRYRIFILISVLILLSCKEEKKIAALDQLAEKYVKLVLKAGLYDSKLIDSYYGPQEWLPTKSSTSTFDFEFFKRRSNALISQLEIIKNSTPLLKAQKKRCNFIIKQLEALKTRLYILNGGVLPFVEETRKLFDIVLPEFNSDWYIKRFYELDKLLPGDGELYARLQKYRKRFIIPAGKLKRIMEIIYREARRVTSKHIELPENEKVRLQFVNRKTWICYNEYKGKNYTILNVNTDNLIDINTAINLICTETYPGHHLMNIKCEQLFYKKNNWAEYSIKPLFSPQSMVLEAIPMSATSLVFPMKRRVSFATDILFPIAGISEKEAEKYFKITELVQSLSMMRIEVARRYLNNMLSKEKAADFAKRHILTGQDTAEKFIAYLDSFRSYPVTTNYGPFLIEKYIKNLQKKTDPTPEDRWNALKLMMKSHILPSDIQNLNEL